MARQWQCLEVGCGELVTAGSDEEPTVAVSVPLGFLIAPALARRLRKNGLPPKIE